MLAPADQALVARDPRLPDLRLLLDASACASLLGDRLGEPVVVTPRYLRYKPGTSCVLSADLKTAAGHGSLLIATYTQHGAPKLAKSVDRAPEGSVLIADPGRGLLVTKATADRDLPGIAALHDRRGHGLVRHLLGTDGPADELAVRTIRHNPQRRWVGLLGPGDRPRAVLRVYRPRRMTGPLAAVQALARSGLGTPRLLGRHKRLGVSAIEFLPGRTLSTQVALDEVQDSSAYHSAGVSLARLHGCGDLGLRPIAEAAESGAVRKSAAQLARLMPETAAMVHDLADRVTGRLQGLPELRQPVHGDFSADQVVIGADGRTALIDLDSARLGDPAADLACACAALARDVALGECTAQDEYRRRRALFDGYRSDGAAIDWDRVTIHEAAHLLRRAVDPFRRRQTPEWTEAAHRLLEAAGDALRAPTLIGAR